MALTTPHHQELTGGDDRRPCILICNWSATQPVWDLVEDLSGVPWEPQGVRTELVDPGQSPAELAISLAERLGRPDVRRLLLVGRTKHDGPVRLQLRAEIPLHDGQRLSHDGPGIVRSTAPTADILEALAKAHVPAVATSENEADAGSELLYDVLSRLDGSLETPAVAMMRFPYLMTEGMIAQAVKSAATVMTQHLTPLPRFAARA
ncbi:hypothetical protein [uncultured Brevundimonas sp.]|uniref:hypothetical protein n=1 Tax=uncultured Brevundimonas sp. TaxID=213418 RepID=UPI00262B87C7|nr:hypothetical protein [uncultured Brevundimonas sp.]